MKSFKAPKAGCPCNFVELYIERAFGFGTTNLALAAFLDADLQQALSSSSQGKRITMVRADWSTPFPSARKAEQQALPHASAGRDLKPCGSRFPRLREETGRGDRGVSKHRTESVMRFDAFALIDYADAGNKVLASIDTATLGTEAQNTISTGRTYYHHLKNDAEMLEAMSNKELRLEPFSVQEESFLRDIVMRQSVSITPKGCTSDITEKWSGWYSALFPWGDDESGLVADIHTNTADLLPPQGVLHIATSSPVVQVFVVNTDEGTRAYVGPASSYYNFCRGRLPSQAVNRRGMADAVSEQSPARSS